MGKIIISDYKGVYTNANLETIQKEYLAVQKNMRTLPGKLVKTFGIGSPANIGSAVATPPASTTWYNLYTYINDRLTSDGLTGRVYIIVGITATTNVLHVYALDEESDDTWRDINSLDSFTFSGTYYHTAARNPILCDNEILRLYPGITNRGVGISYSGVWIGYIDREYFDGLYDPTAAFYDAKTDIDKPVITATGTGLGLRIEQKSGGDGLGPYNPSGEEGYATRYYKISYIYDGTQESLLSNTYGIQYSADTFGCMYLHLISNSFNKRITGINIYRSTIENADYKKIQNIDFLRTSDSTLSGSISVGSQSTNESTRNGRAYVPDLDGYVFYSAYDYKLRIYGYGDSYWEDTIPYYVDDANATHDLDGTGRTVFTYETPSSDNTTETTLWNKAWVLMKSTDGGSNYSSDSEGAYGAFAGQNIAIMLDYTGTGKSDMIGGAIYSEYENTFNVHDIVDNYVKAFLFKKRYMSDDTAAATATASYRIIKPSSGYYFPRPKRGYITTVSDAGGGSSYFICAQPHTLTVNDTITISGFTDGNTGYNGEKTVSSVFSTHIFAVEVAFAATGAGIWVDSDKIQYLFFDTGQEGTDPYPISEATPSILVHSEFATVVNNRGWYAGRIILDPGGANESQRNDAIAYSEDGQIDVVPSQNLIRLIEREGGICTGLASLFGNPVFLKKQGIIYIDTKTGSTEPTSWRVIESIHNIGNVSKQGYFNWGDVLGVWYHDGGYLIRPNNLSASDSTPTEKLKFTDAIEDLYLSMTDAQRSNIKTEVDPVRSEVICVFPFTTPEIWAYNLVTGSWRQILSGVTIGMMAKDENNQIMVYQASDKKVYSFGANESVAIDIKTLPLRLSFNIPKAIQRITVNYKSVTDTLTLYVYYDEEVPSGDIREGIEYYADADSPSNYITYNGSNYDDGETITGVLGTTTYTITGTGKVLLRDSFTLPVHNVMKEEWFAPHARANIMRIELVSAASTNSIEIGQIVIDIEE